MPGGCGPTNGPRLRPPAGQHPGFRGRCLRGVSVSTRRWAETSSTRRPSPPPGCFRHLLWRQCPCRKGGGRQGKPTTGRKTRVGEGGSGGCTERAPPLPLDDESGPGRHPPLPTDGRGAGRISGALIVSTSDIALYASPVTEGNRDARHVSQRQDPDKFLYESNVLPSVMCWTLCITQSTSIIRSNSRSRSPLPTNRRRPWRTRATRQSSTVDTPGTRLRSLQKIKRSF